MIRYLIMKKIQILLIIIFCFLSGLFFYNVNLQNYKKISEIKYSIVNHPELLPQKEVLKLTSFWFSNLRASIYWLRAIQYVWSNAMSEAYKKYLFSMLDVIAELNPYFEKPYTVWQLLIPWVNRRYSDDSIQLEKKYNSQAEYLWLKWIKNFCDSEKIKKIIDFEDVWELWNQENLKNPCKNFKIPFNQAYIYYYYLDDNNKSTDYYKITSMIDWAPVGSKNLAAVMSWKAWNNLKSFIMLMTLANTYNVEGGCGDKINLLAFIYDQYIKTGEFPYELLSSFWQEIIEEKQENVSYWESCWDYINKALRHLNLEYLNKALQKYKNEYNTANVKLIDLHIKGYIEFIPVDYQKWVEYYYDNEKQLISYRVMY